MTFRTRLLLTFLLAVLVPIIVFAFFVRNEMTDRLTSQSERRVESLVTVIEEDLARQSRTIAASLAGLRRAIVDDNRFRRAIAGDAGDERRYLLDFAQNARRLVGLSMLQIQDDTGRIVSSGHFRNEYDRVERELPVLLADLSSPDSTGFPVSTLGGAALVVARAPNEPFLALARVDSFRMGGERFSIVGGIAVERSFLDRLAREAELTVTLNYPGGLLTSGAGTDETGAEPETPRDRIADRNVVRELGVPFIDSPTGRIDRAAFRVSHEMSGLQALHGSVDRWFMVAAVTACFLAILLVIWFASRISRPLTELADKTSRIDLDRLDIDFDTRRNDEIGALSRLLGKMTGRLRASAAAVKDAERRATMGELARQVNHDIKNGLIPIRNVFRHMAQLARSDPGQLPKVFEERHGTVDSSIDYLENLASNYARLSKPGDRRPCDVNGIVRRIVADTGSPGQDVDVRTSLGDGAVVVGDPLSLRRILENLVSNAIDSLESGRGSVTISTVLVAAPAGRPGVRITVADTGAGLTKEQISKVFDDFYTTKESGTGLGLSIVRRLVMDLDGSIAVESRKGKGSRFVVDLPGPVAAL